MRPKPWGGLRDVPTLWADYTTGRGVLGNGQSVRPKIGERRKNPNLQDMLDTAADAGAERIMFTGKVPLAEQGQRHWLLVQTPGWKSVGHWLAAPVTGRFERIATGQRVEVRTISEWFGSVPLNPEQARQAWDATKFMVSEAFPGAPLALTPAATGTNLWALSLPKTLDPEPLTDDIAAEIHRTSGQHHLEHLVAGPSFSTHEDCLPLVDPAQTPTLPRFAYTDGRFMYASLCRELGTGPGVRLNRQGTYDLLNADPYARARVLIRFTVPDTWNHVGLFGVQHHRQDQGWYYPNRPGATAETWADTAEIHVARKHGWVIDPVEAVAFNKHMPNRTGDKPVAARPLDTFAQRITRARDWITHDEEMPPIIRAAASAALRAILIQTIGAFASRGRGRTVIVWDPKDVPPQYLESMKRQGKAFVYKEPAPLAGAARAYYRPELAAQVWARGRAKVLETPMANGATGGALAVPARTLLGINGDAIYTSEVPRWALPVEHGGADDGKTGRLRLQGYIEGPVKTPASRDERDRLREKAVRQGIDGAINFTEFLAPSDDADFIVGDTDEQ